MITVMNDRSCSFGMKSAQNDGDGRFRSRPNDDWLLALRERLSVLGLMERDVGGAEILRLFVATGDPPAVFVEAPGLLTLLRSPQHGRVNAVTRHARRARARVDS